MTHTWMFIRKTHLSLACRLFFSSVFPCNFRVSTSKAPRTRYHPQRLPWWWPVQSSPGEHLPHPEGARQFQHLPQGEKLGETAGNPNDWIVCLDRFRSPLLGSRTCWCQRCSSCNALWEEPELHWNATKKCMDGKIEKEISPKLQAKIDRKTYWNLDQCV